VWGVGVGVAEFFRSSVVSRSKGGWPVLAGADSRSIGCARGGGGRFGPPIEGRLNVFGGI